MSRPYRPNACPECDGYGHREMPLRTCPVCNGTGQKAMTPAAPPEKMMLGDLPCPACGGTPYDVGHGAVTCQNNQCALREIRIMRSDWNRNRRVGISKHRDGWTGEKCSHCEGNGCAKCGNTGDEYDGTQDDREAARRLSAPAPAAPRVGDDAIGLANIAKFCWEDAEAEIRELTEALGVSRQMRDEDWRVIAKLRYDCAEWKRQALSAPPAASADEREDDTDNMVCYWCGKRDAELQGDDSLDDGPGGAWFVQCRECHATGPIMQTEPEALTAWKSGPGYRKRAPAQSVGQSAAQGVGEFAAELVKWCDEHLAAHPDVTVRTTLAFVIDHIRRLSALPKGQDDE